MVVSIFAVVVLLVLVAAFFAYQKGYFWQNLNPDAYGALPPLSHFKTSPSDQFVVDMEVVQGGNPYKGRRANDPHAGAHVNFLDEYKKWPKGGSAPSNYPPIYAAADGVVYDVQYSFKVNANDRYGVDIAIAKDGRKVWSLGYSIEPFVPEPSKNFYRPFIVVKPGEVVKKGQIIAYMYLAPGVGGGGPHIHFDLLDGQGHFPPAIFAPAIVRAFHERGAVFGGFDGVDRIPACMGYKLEPDENPFEPRVADCL